jgi:hypothetical protein
MILRVDVAQRHPSVPREEFKDQGVARQTNSSRYPLNFVGDDVPEIGQYSFDSGVYLIAYDGPDKFEVKFRTRTGFFTSYIDANPDVRPRSD